jgi:ParB family transcriptional regulator, chromosome partitioning protein
MTRRALGKGLRSLIPETPARVPVPQAAAAEPVRNIDIDQIRGNRRQPRQRFDEDALEALARSLKAEGVLQPVLVRPLPDGRFELVAGERRWRAAQRAGLLKIPAVIRDVPDDRLLEVALIENLQRENLNPIEEAQAYRALIENVGMKQQDVADHVGKQRASVANALRLLSLSAPVQERLKSGELNMGQGRALASLPDLHEQERLAERAVREGLSVRQLESLVAGNLEGAKDRKAKSLPRRDPNVVAAEENLQRAMGGRVRIVEGRKGGRIELHFYNREEMQRVYQLVLEVARRKGGA